MELKVLGSRMGMCKMDVFKKGGVGGVKRWVGVVDWVGNDYQTHEFTFYSRKYERSTSVKDRRTLDTRR